MTTPRRFAALAVCLLALAAGASAACVPGELPCLPPHSSCGCPACTPPVCRQYFPFYAVSFCGSPRSATTK